jgi:hypothetical protein
MTPGLDTEVTLYFSNHQGVSYEVLDSVLSYMARAVRRLEKNDFELCVEILRDYNVPEVTIDAARFRFENLDYRRFITITKASTGSIELIIALAGAAYWIVDKTLGETLKDAWKQTSAHEKLVVILSNKMKARKVEIAEALRPHRLPSTQGLTITSSHSQDAQAPLQIIFTIERGSPAEPIPPLSELIDERRVNDV